MSSSFTGNIGGQIQESFVLPAEGAAAHIRIRQYLNDIAYALNRKDSGYFVTESTTTGQQFVPTFDADNSSSVFYRPVLRKVIDTGTLPNTGTTNTAHEISIGTEYSVTRVYGAATDPTAITWIPLPYASPTLANNIELQVGGTNVTITTGSDRTSFTRSWVIVEYITTI